MFLKVYRTPKHIFGQFSEEIWLCGHILMAVRQHLSGSLCSPPATQEFNDFFCSVVSQLRRLITSERYVLTSNPASSNIFCTCWSRFLWSFDDLRQSLVATAAFLGKSTSKSNKMVYFYNSYCLLPNNEYSKEVYVSSGSEILICSWMTNSKA